MITFDSPFEQVAVLLLLGSVVGFVGLLLRQPLIVSFIATGLLAGPSGLDLIGDAGQIEALSRLGIAVLLFLVGLKLDVHLIRQFGRVAAMTGLGQVLFTAGFGFLICLALGMSATTSAYVAVALTFSSTIIIVKLLSDKHEIDSLHGKIALGFLIVQDLVVVVAMVALSAIGATGGASGGLGDLLQVALGGVLLLGAAALFILRLAEPLLARISRSPELLVVFAIAWAALFATAADMLGLSKELGGLVAGVALGSTSYREAIASRLSSLRDFLLLFFFIELGSLFDLGQVGDQVVPAIVLSLFVLIGNPLIVLIIMGAMGYRKRTGFLAGLTVAQISEFSLIFVALGLSLGHIEVEAVGLTTLVGLVTIGLSTYMILHSATLYRWLEPLLAPFERRVALREDSVPLAAQPQEAEVIVFGLGRYGTALAEALSNNGRSVLGVDFDPEAVKLWRQRGLSAVYGDAADPDFPATLPLAGARWVVCTVRNPPGALAYPDPQAALVEALRGHGHKGRMAVTAVHERQRRALDALRVDLVLEPYTDAAGRAAERLD